MGNFGAAFCLGLFMLACGEPTFSASDPLSKTGGGGVAPSDAGESGADVGGSSGGISGAGSGGATSEACSVRGQRVECDLLGCYEAEKECVGGSWGPCECVDDATGGTDGVGGTGAAGKGGSGGESMAGTGGSLGEAGGATEPVAGTGGSGVAGSSGTAGVGGQVCSPSIDPVIACFGKTCGPASDGCTDDAYDCGECPGTHSCTDAGACELMVECDCDALNFVCGVLPDCPVRTDCGRCPNGEMCQYDGENGTLCGQCALDQDANSMGATYCAQQEHGCTAAYMGCRKIVDCPGVGQWQCGP